MWLFSPQNPYYHIRFIWSLLDDDDARFFGKDRLLLVNATFSALLLVCQSTTRKCYDIHMKKKIQSKRQKEKNLWKSMQMFATLYGYMDVSGVQSAETGTFSCTCISAPTKVYTSTIDTKRSAFNRFIRNTSKAFFGSIDSARCLVCLHTYVWYLFFCTSIALFRSLLLAFIHLFVRSFFLSFFLLCTYQLMWNLQIHFNFQSNNDNDGLYLCMEINYQNVLFIMSLLPFHMFNANFDANVIFFLNWVFEPLENCE